MNEKRVFVIINSKALNNFISQQLINEFETTTKFKKNSYDLIIINKNSLLNNDGQVLRLNKF